MMTVFEEISWRWCRHNTVPLSHIRSTVSDDVCPSPKGGVLAPSKSATDKAFVVRGVCVDKVKDH